MKSTQDALAFIEHLIVLYFVKRDINTLLSCMDEQVTLLGLDDQEICHDRLGARLALEQTMPRGDRAVVLKEKQLQVQALASNLFLVYGEAVTSPIGDSLINLQVHISCLCRVQGESFLLLHANVSRPKQARELKEYAHQLENMTCYIPGGVHRCANDPQFTLLSLSDSFLAMFGYTLQELENLFQNKFIEIVHPADRSRVQCKTYQQLRTKDTVELEYKAVCKDGSVIWVLEQCRLLSDSDGRKCFYCVLMDITQRKNAQEALRISLERHEMILDQTNDIIFEWNIPNDTLQFSPNWYKKFNYPPMQTEILSSLAHSEDIHPEDRHLIVEMIHQVNKGVPYLEEELRIRKGTGEHLWCRVRVTTQFNAAGQPFQAVGVIIDIQSEKRERQALLEMAQCDGLTGLYNKSSIRAQVEQQMEAKQDNLPQALFIVDLDNFKNVNDTYGHLCGDALLTEIADILKHAFRSSDLVGRIGGDEFLVYLPQVADQEAAKAKATALLTKLQCVRPTKDALPIFCSIGAVLAPSGTVDYLGMYHNADIALYHQKNIGKSGITFYGDSLFEDTAPFAASHSAISENITSEDMHFGNDRLVQYTFHMLYQAVAVPAAIHQLLEIVGRACHVSRVYIFENSQDGLFCSNTFEWCEDGIQPAMENLQNLSYETDLPGFQENLLDSGFFYTPDVTTLAQPLYDIVAPQGIRAMLHCAILDHGVFRGYIGFDECNENRHWSKEQVATLSIIANMLSVFLRKYRMEQELSAL